MTKTAPAKETPLMQQYNRIKAKYPDALLLFRVGDFYETFGADAITTSKVLGIVLTKRANGSASHVELAGFPHHALDTYLPKMVRAGHRVAICDQLEDPKLTKKIVKRGVTELVTPGVAHDDKILDHKTNNFLAAVHIGKEIHGISFLDISTGEFLLAEGHAAYVDKLLQSFKPSEVVYPKNKGKAFHQLFGSKFCTFPLDEWVYTDAYSQETLLGHFQVNSLKGYGVDNLKAGIIAAGAALHYIAATEHPNIKHITTVTRIEEDKYVWLDKFTIRNLELLHSPNEDGTPLIKILDQTLSPMGGRLLKRWISLPLKDLKPIESRQNIVAHLIKAPELYDTVTQHLKEIGDIERLIAKIALGKVNPRELVQLKNALQAIHPIKKACQKAENRDLKEIGKKLDPCEALIDKISHSLQDDPPVQIGKGYVIRDQVDEELDELRAVVHSGKDYLVKIQQRETERTGIPSLKIGFNNVFGYYLEVTHTHKQKVPAEWIRKQTLTNAERYITEELKEYEQKIIGAEDKILSLEEKLFLELVVSLHPFIEPVQQNAYLLAKLDCLLSFAKNATAYNYRQPELNDGLAISIKEGRHPVIEQLMEPGESYVPNDLLLDDRSQQIIIITGPNMAGKSALLRQTALIVLMAQMGSFVPATSAKIGLVDKIFTRVGASDNISSGESTFMVEMNETASILNNISPRSLILLDEIGRGTSTYDGISIAWSIGEYLHNYPGGAPKTLFATHYHELNELANKYDRIKNYNISTRETGGKVIFLRKLVPGGSKHSFGIHVAKMAGMPPTIVNRGHEILKQLEQKSIGVDLEDNLRNLQQQDLQLSIFQMDDPKMMRIKEALEEIDINTLSPVEALLKLNELKALMEG